MDDDKDPTTTWRQRLDQFEESTREMPHTMRCATRIDGPRADCSCDRAAVLSWIDYVRRGAAA